MYQPLSPEEEAHRRRFLCDVVAGAPGAGKPALTLSLPFFHTCRGRDFRGIFTKKFLIPSECPEFHEKLLYLFYGKPAYRIHSTGLSSKDIGRFPVCFVINTKSAGSIKRIFPFDTGALIHDVLKDVCGEEKNPAKYELGTDVDVISQFISFFYGSDKQYFMANPQISQRDIPGFSFELQQIYLLISERSEKQWDNRAYTIESQCVTDISISKTNISAIIMPSIYMNSQEIVDFIFNEGIEVIPYSLDRADPAHMSPLIIGLAEKYLETQGIL